MDEEDEGGLKMQVGPVFVSDLRHTHTHLSSPSSPTLPELTVYKIERMENE